MSTPEPDSTFDENVISEILRVQERAHGVREARAALARWVSRSACALAMLVLCTGLVVGLVNGVGAATATQALCTERSEEHTSELQSRFELVCRLLLEKKKSDTQGP